VLLQNLQTPTDVFDLKISGNIDIDYIVDPTGTLNGNEGAGNMRVYFANGSTLLTANASYPSSGYYYFSFYTAAAGTAFSLTQDPQNSAFSTVYQTGTVVYCTVSTNAGRLSCPAAAPFSVDGTDNSTSYAVAGLLFPSYLGGSTSTLATLSAAIATLFSAHGNDSYVSTTLNGLSYPTFQMAAFKYNSLVLSGGAFWAAPGGSLVGSESNSHWALQNMILLTVGTNGSVVPTVSGTALSAVANTNSLLLSPNGDSPSFLITPTGGYTPTVSVDGSVVTPTNNGNGTYTYSLSSISTPHAVYITFAIAGPATYYWVGGVTDAYTNTAGNWSTSSGSCVSTSGNASLPTSSNDVFFTSSCTDSATINSALSVNNFNINSGYTGTVTQGANLTAATSTTIKAGILTEGASYSDNLGALAVNGGTVTLAGTNSSWSGGTTLSSGELDVNSATALGTGDLIVSGGTIDNTSGGTIINSGNNTQTWSGDFAFGGTNNLDLGTGTVALSANRIITTNGSATLTIGGVISGSSKTLTKAGAGAFALTGNNTYTGLTTVSAGTLTLSGDNSSASGGVTLSGGTLNVNSATALGTGTFTISGGTIDSTSSDITNSKNNTQAWNGDFIFTGTHNLNLGTGAVTLSANRAVTVNGSTLTVAGVISDGAGGSKALTKAGAGTLALNGTNTFSGGTILSAGTLSAGANSVSALGSGGFTQNGGTFNGGSGALTITGAVSLTSGIFNSTSKTLSLSGNFSNSGATFNANNGTVVFNGTQGISGTNTFNNIIVNGGVTNNGTSDVTSLTGGGTWTQGTNSTLNYSGVGASIVASATGNTVNYTDDAPITIPTSTTYYNLGIGTGTLTNNRNYTLNGTLRVNNVLTVGPTSGSYTATLVDGGHTIVLYGAGTPFVINSKGAYSPTGNVTYEGSSATNVTQTTYNNLTFLGTGTYTLAGPLTCNGYLDISNGALSTAGNSISVADFDVYNDISQTFDATGSTINITGTGTVINWADTSAFTLTSTGSTWNITDTSANTKTINIATTAGSPVTFPNINIAQGADDAVQILL
jgi:autotransporter-associated beta strand protein